MGSTTAGDRGDGWRLLTSDEARERLGGIGEDVLRRLIEEEGLPVWCPGGHAIAGARRLFDPDALREWVRGQIERQGADRDRLRGEAPAPSGPPRGPGRKGRGARAGSGGPRKGPDGRYEIA